MEKMKLKDLINIRTGKLDANASSENGKYPFFTCSKETLKINTYSYDCECVLLAGNGDLNVKYYNGKFAGSIELKDLDFRNKKTEIGYWLAKEFTGKGIMVKTTKFMIDYAFNELDLNRVSILTATENYASQAIPEKLGFTKEGMLKDNECLYGKFLDNYIYGMTKEKWNNVNN